VGSWLGLRSRVSGFWQYVPSCLHPGMIPDCGHVSAVIYYHHLKFTNVKRFYCFCNCRAFTWKKLHHMDQTLCFSVCLESSEPEYLCLFFVFINNLLTDCCICCFVNFCPFLVF